MKREFFLLLIIFLVIFSFGFTAMSEDSESTEDKEAEYETYEIEEIEEAIPEAEVTPPETPQEPTTIDLSQVQVETYEVETISYEDYEIITEDGPIVEFSMTNALFSLGSLIQGSFISFSDNNALFFSSLFDASEFVATLDSDSEIDVAQRNGFGSTGQVYITLESGNLTQDEVIIFVPEGNNPTYIYYNTTEIEFEDGTIYLLGESVTNSDETQDSTSVLFDENGFTRVELHSNNTYTSFDYSMINTGEETLIICKDDPLCDINIEDSTIKIKGLVNLTYTNATIYSSQDSNNIFTLDLNLGEATLSNTRVNEETLAYLYSGNHLITETEEQIFDKPVEEEKPTLIQTYTSTLKEKTISIDNEDTLSYENFAAYDTKPSTSSSSLITAAAIGITTASSASLGLILIILGSIIMISLLAEYNFKMKKKGQMSIFLTLGIVVIIIVFLVIYVSQFSLSSETGKTLAQVESLEQAREAVESCVEEEVLEYFYLQGESGAQLALRDSKLEESSFDTYYGFLEIEEIEENLNNYIQENLDCSYILESTDYVLESSRFESEVTLDDEVKIEISSLGQVYKSEDSSNYESVRDVEINLDLDYSKLHLILETLYSQDLGNPIESYEGYVINTFVNRDYTEQLLWVYEEESEYSLKIVKLL